MKKYFIFICEIMESGDLAQTAINILEGSGNVADLIGSPFSSSEGVLATLLQSSFWFWTAIIVFLLRLATLIRTIKDASARSSSFWFLLLSVFLIVAFTPIFGLLLYIAIRPQGRKWDKSPRRDMLFQKSQICGNCGEFNQIDYLYCIYCGENLHITCRECQNKYSKSYFYCPKCGAPCLEE